MTQLPDETLERLAEVVQRRLGLHFPRDRWRELARGVEAACHDLGETGVESCMRNFLSSSLDRRQMELLGVHLTVGETYFFREAQAYRTLATQILPELLAARRDTGRSIRFWSAACATGEEPYSLAILLRERIPDVDQWNATILATDINPDSLRKAEEGAYRDWSFRGERGGIKDIWFSRTEDGRFQIRPEVRKMVTFAYHNLAEDIYPSLANGTNAMDVIFCRNVLMYFSEQSRQEVLRRLSLCLVEGGLLVAGATESSLRPPPGVEPIPFSDLVAYRKKTVGTLPSSPPRPPSRPAPPRKPSTPPPAEKADEALSRLREAFARGDYGFVCRRAADLSPGHSDHRKAALIAARACANSGNLEHALSWVDTAISDARLNPEAHYLKAMILVEQDRSREALDALRTTLYLDPDFIPAYVALGNLHRRNGEHKQSERNFRNALVLLDPFGEDDPVPHAEEMRAGRMREAVLAALGDK